MSYKAALAATALAVVSVPAFAQGITGGQLGLEYSAPTDGSDFGGTIYHGGLEYGINRQFSVGVNATGYNPDNLNISGSNITLHGIYHVNEMASAGVFVGRDKLEDDDAPVVTYGIEGGTEFMGGDVSAYFGKTDTTGGDANIFGAEGTYGFQNGFSVIAGIDHLTTSATSSVTRSSIGGSYNLTGGPDFYAQVGNISAESSGTASDQTFIGVGASIAFGAARGTTFNGRSVFDAVAGF